MTYGVTFTVEKDYPTSSRKFKELLNAIDVEKYVWKVDESDFYNIENLQNILEKKNIITGKDVLKELDCEVMMIWIALEGYKDKNDVEESDNSFQNYLKSKCETAVFVVDTRMFSVYSKNTETLKKAVDFAKNNTTGTFEIIEEEHTERYFGI
ncbi:MAG: DUF2691 family protein [Ruminococcaceae bacterium]|nr:DUF2691 family protein [Oscillospiraceae bacterium]